MYFLNKQFRNIEKNQTSLMIINDKMKFSWLIDIDDKSEIKYFVKIDIRYLVI